MFLSRKFQSNSAKSSVTAKIVVGSVAAFLSLVTVIGLAPVNGYAQNTKAQITKTSDPGAAAEKRMFVYVTLYGSPDNDPPGSGDIAYPVIHEQAGGKGTFKDPVTFAVKPGFLPVGQVMYYPTLRKYFIMEDNCATCTRHEVDLWAGYGSARGGILRCEDNLTVGSDAIIVSPTSNHPVDTTPIWNESTKKCQTPY